MTHAILDRGRSSLRLIRDLDRIGKPPSLLTKVYTLCPGAARGLQKAGGSSVNRFILRGYPKRYHMRPGPASDASPAQTRGTHNRIADAGGR